MNIIEKIIQKFGCGHEYVFVRNIYGDEVNQCGGYRSLWQCYKCGKQQYRQELHIDDNEKFKEVLDELYDDYYKNEYENWCKTNEDFLIKLKFDLANAASKGLYYYKFVFTSKEETNDKHHFEEWIEENDLRYDYELYNNQLEENDVINQYSFDIRWK